MTDQRQGWRGRLGTVEKVVSLCAGLLAVAGFLGIRSATRDDGPPPSTSPPDPGEATDPVYSDVELSLSTPWCDQTLVDLDEPRVGASATGAELAVIDTECGLSPDPYVLTEATASVISAEPGPAPTVAQCLDRLETAPTDQLTFGGEGGVFCFATDRGRVVGAVLDRSTGAPFIMTIDAWE